MRERELGTGCCGLFARRRGQDARGWTRLKFPVARTPGGSRTRCASHPAGSSDDGRYSAGDRSVLQSTPSTRVRVRHKNGHYPMRNRRPVDPGGGGGRHHPRRGANHQAQLARRPCRQAGRSWKRRHDRLTGCPTAAVRRAAGAGSGPDATGMVRDCEEYSTSSLRGPRWPAMRRGTKVLRGSAKRESLSAGRSGGAGGATSSSY